MAGRLIVVYGDIVADRFVYGTPKRISREAPVLILRQYRDDILLGGAGNAINNILSLGGVPLPVSVVGDDAAGRQLLSQLTAEGIDCSSLQVDRYHTPTKVRILGGFPHAARQQIVRYDIEDRFDIAPHEAEQFANMLRVQIGVAHAGMISDYGYGVVTARARSSLTTYAHGKPVTLDSRYDLLGFPGVTAATPNEEEAAAAAGTTLYDGENGDHRIGQVAQTLRESLDCEAVLITRGSRGMALLERAADTPLFIPVYGTDQVADVTGAGDTVIATFTLALAAQASFAEAAKLANYAGGTVVMKMGTATCSTAELRHAIERDEDLQE